jgi:IS30 family transposase
MCLENVADEKVMYVQNKLNNRPEKKLGYLTPNQFFLITLQ